MANALNPTLYRTLQTHFGEVHFRCQGMKFDGDYVIDPFSGRDKLQIRTGGEGYQVNCPDCNDTTHRLNFNHTWGKRDERGSLRLWLMGCYNEECYNNREKQKEMYERLTALTGTLPNARIRPGQSADVVEGPKDWPGECTPLHELPRSHRANVWLAQRQYDPELLSRYYGVRYCSQSFMRYARDRIIAPVIHRGEILGFQTRPPEDLDWKALKIPKWWTYPGTPRARVFYNGDRAQHYRTGVIVEGPGDVWGFGPMAVGLMGSAYTPMQQRLFMSWFRSGSGVLLLDPEAMQERDKWTGELVIDKYMQAMAGKFRYGFAAVELPAGRDPGNTERGWMRDFVRQEALKQGVKVDYRKK